MSDDGDEGEEEGERRPTSQPTIMTDPLFALCLLLRVLALISRFSLNIGSSDIYRHGRHVIFSASCVGEVVGYKI